MRDEHNDKFDNAVSFLNRNFWKFVKDTAHMNTTPFDMEMFTLALWLMDEAIDDFLYERVHTHLMDRRINGLNVFMKWFTAFGNGDSTENYTNENVVDDFDIQNKSKWYIFEYYITQKRERQQKLNENYGGGQRKTHLNAA